MKTIVSITPIKVAADSRTFKQAASMKRFGFHSVVIEGEISQFSANDLPFCLQSIRGNPSESRRYLSKMLLDESSGFNIKRFVKNVSKLLPNFLKDFIRLLLSKDLLKFLLFAIHYSCWAGLRPLRFIPRASLYYLHAPYLFPAVFLLSKFYRVPYIYDAHDFYIRIEEDHERPPFLKRWIDPFYKKIEESCIHHAAAVVTVSEGIADLIDGAFCVQPIVIRNCQDSRLEKMPSTSLRNVAGLSPSDFLLVMIGQAKKGMAIRECLEAMVMLPSHVHLAFLGNNYEQHLEMVRNYGLGERVHVVQPVKPFEIISFVRSADAAIILYYARSVNYEFCLPNGFFQSLSAELPLLYPELPEIKRLAETYKLGIPIDPSIPSSIMTAVKELIESPTLKLQFHENAHRAKEDLSWEKEEAILRNLVVRVLKHR